MRSTNGLAFLLAPVLTFGAACAHSSTDPAIERRADAIARTAATQEPATTARLVELCETYGAEMFKLKYRLKKRGSIVRKLRLIQKKRPELAAEELSLNDALRYTMKIADRPAGHYRQTAHAVLAALASDGHEVIKVKNYWPRGDNYSGVNASLRTPNGLVWELQFQTPESADTNLRTRAWYEELRAASTSRTRKQKLFDLMSEAWESVPIPAGMLEAKALHPRDKVIRLDRP